MKTVSENEIGVLAYTSAKNFFRLLSSHSLHLRKNHFDKLYWVDQKGAYKVFRETISDKKTTKKSVVLIVGFRLRLIRLNPLLHWIFQKICIVTTPFWSGLPGFRVKLWMVDPKTKDYLGIYQWEGEKNAYDYVNALIKVLRPLSTKDSVWYELLHDTKLDAYLHDHKVIVPGRKRLSITSVLHLYYQSMPFKY